MDYDSRYVERDIIKYLKEGKKVYVEDGCLVDIITGWEKARKETFEFWDEGFFFFTSASVFPKRISLWDFNLVREEEFNGNLFVYVTS